MRAIQVLIACIGRICMGSLFLLEGINRILDWSGSIRQLNDGLARFACFPELPQYLVDLADTLTFWTTTLMGVTIFCLVVGGLLVFFGLKTRFGAFLLILFTLGTMGIFHAFWLFPPEERSTEMVMFTQHLAILGGLLTLLAFGNGACKKPSSKSKGA